MLEILALVFLTRKNGIIAEKKGHKPSGYKWLTVLLWFGGEIAGGVLGAVIASGDEGLGESSTCWPWWAPCWGPVCRG